MSGMESVAKVDNHARSYADKVEIRGRVLDTIGADKASVLDCFAGSGHMFRAVWHRAARYVGCDMRFFFDQRTTYVCDNKILLRSIDLHPFNVFDLDAYGSPWEQIELVAQRRPVAKGERLGLVITEGSGLRLKFGGVPKAFAEMAGCPVALPSAIRAQDDILDAAIANLAVRMGCKIEKRWQARRAAGSSMRYEGLILRRA